MVRRRSSTVPHSLLVVDSSCGHNWCLCFRQMGQSWRMWWIVCSASLQSQSAESMMPVRLRCALRQQCPVRNLNIVVCSCLARRLQSGHFQSQPLLLFLLSVTVNNRFGRCQEKTFLSLLLLFRERCANVSHGLLAKSCRSNDTGTGKETR